MASWRTPNKPESLIFSSLQQPRTDIDRGLWQRPRPGNQQSPYLGGRQIGEFLPQQRQHPGYVGCSHAGAADRVVPSRPLSKKGRLRGRCRLGGTGVGLNARCRDIDAAIRVDCRIGEISRAHGTIDRCHRHDGRAVGRTADRSHLILAATTVIAGRGNDECAAPHRFPSGGFEGREEALARLHPRSERHRHHVAPLVDRPFDPREGRSSKRGTLIGQDFADKNLRLMRDSISPAARRVPWSACRPDTVGPVTIIVVNGLAWNERFRCNQTAAEVGVIEVKTGIEDSDLDTFATEPGIESLDGL